MKQRHFILSLTFLIGVGTFIASPLALAAKTYTGQSIKGSYYYLTTETRDEGGVIQHCQGNGVAIFFADGTMEICGSGMCNGVAEVPEPGFFEYVIDGDEILITEVGEPDSTHCKILNNGRMMLCDGSQRTIPELLSWTGTVVKMENKPNPDLLIAEGCSP